MEPEITETVPIFEASLQLRNTVGFISSENSNIDTDSTSDFILTGEASKNGTIWMHFIKNINFINNKKAFCKYCNKKYICSQESTTNLHSYLKKHHSVKLQHASSNESTSIIDIFTNTKVNIYLFFINFISITSINLYIIYI